MIYENEIVMILIALFVLVFVFMYKHKIKTIKNANILLFSYYTFIVGWICTIAEGFVFPFLLNVIEHVSYVVGVVCLLIWIIKFSKK